MWEAIPWDLGFGRAGRVSDAIFRYPFEDRSFLLVKLHHPSQGYPSEESHRILASVGAAAFVDGFAKPSSSNKNCLTPGIRN